VLSAVAYLHARDIIHADLKPDNVLLSAPGDLAVAKLSDFGLAKVRADLSSTHASMVAARGTPLYMDPQLYADIVSGLHVSTSGDPFVTAGGAASAAAGAGGGAGATPALRGSLRKPSDVFSAGIMLWQCVTGAEPYASVHEDGAPVCSSVPRLQSYVANGGRPATPSELAALRPDGIGPLIACMWDAAAARRPTAEVAEERLAALIARLGT
jgi:serine/threonine protein kinase